MRMPMTPDTLLLGLVAALLQGPLPFALQAHHGPPRSPFASRHPLISPRARWAGSFCAAPQGQGGEEENGDQETEDALDLLIEAADARAALGPENLQKVQDLFAEGSDSLREALEEWQRSEAISEERGDRLRAGSDRRREQEAARLMSRIEGLVAEFDASLPDSARDASGRAAAPLMDDASKQALQAVEALVRKASGSRNGDLGRCVVVTTPKTRTDFTDGLLTALRGIGIEVVAGAVALESSAAATVFARERNADLSAAGRLIVCPLGDRDELSPVDPGAVQELLDACPRLGHAILVSSLGVNRAGKFPYALANVMGALDRRRAAEQVVLLSSRIRGFSHTILRVGKLRGITAPLRLEPGDALDGDVDPMTAVSALRYAAEFPTALNTTSSLTGVAKESDDWADLFLRLDGPELLRVRLKPDILPSTARIWLSDWANKWKLPGSGLTTPVEVRSTDSGIMILFSPTTSDFVSAREEKELERENAKEGRSAERQKTTRASRVGQEGGVELVIEEQPQMRIRARRCAYGEDAVVKEISEEEIIRSLRRSLSRWSGADQAE